MPPLLTSPSCSATSCAARASSPSSSGSAVARAPRLRWCSLGMTSTCVGACGLMSRKARVRSVSRTTSGGISPRTILQNRQSLEVSVMAWTVGAAGQGRRRNHGSVPVAVPEVSRVRSPAPHEDVVSTPPAVRSGGSAQLQHTLSTAFAERPTEPPTRRIAVAGVLLALVVAVAVLLWAKWIPYQAKVAGLRQSHSWAGTSILTVGDVRPGDGPSWHAATTFFTTYLQAIWKALVAALLISAAVQAFVPRTWLLGLLNRPGRLRSAAVGGLVSTPSMMCTCCTAPVAATLRRDGVSPSAALAYWLGNPLLNPAVIVFLALVAPWQWTVTRVAVGALVVVGGSALVARFTTRPEIPVEQVTGDAQVAPADWFGTAPGRFGRTLGRLLVTLVPEYLVVVLAVGAFRGWLFPLGDGAVHGGVLVVLVAAVVGTLLVLPTGGEIPVLQGLALAGMSLGGLGALLLTLPAVSLPGIAMVGRAFGWRTTWATAAVVAAGGVVAAALLTALG